MSRSIFACSTTFVYGAKPAMFENGHSESAVVSLVSTMTFEYTVAVPAVRPEHAT